MTVKKYVANIEDLSNKKIILTGGTSGIGKALTFHLANKNATILLLARNEEKINNTIKEIKEQYPNANISYHLYDQADYSSIEETVKYILKEHQDFHALILNAGVLAGPKGGLTKDGYPLTVGVNFLGVKHFIDCIVPNLKSNHKIIIQGSIVAFGNVKKKDDLYSPKNGMFKQYNLSKIYLESYFHYWNEKYDQEFILTEPGVSATNVTQYMNSFVRVSGKYFLKATVHSPKKACLPLLLAVSSKTKKGDYITPRGLFTITGFPKIKKFPNRRIREHLIFD